MCRNHAETQTEIKEFCDNSMQTDEIVDVKGKKELMLAKFRAGF